MRRLGAGSTALGTAAATATTRKRSSAGPAEESFWDDRASSGAHLLRSEVANEVVHGHAGTHALTLQPNRGRGPDSDGRLLEVCQQCGEEGYRLLL